MDPFQVRKAIEHDLSQHGHVHIIMDEEIPHWDDNEIDASQGKEGGNIDFDTPTDVCFTITAHGVSYRLYYDSVVASYAPE